MISFRIDSFDHLAIQGILKSLLQQHNLKASIIQLSAFFMVQCSHLYVTTGKTIALTIQTFFSKWHLCFLIHCLGLSWFAFQKSKRLLILWLQSPSIVILAPKKIKSATLPCFPFLCQEVMGEFVWLVLHNPESLWCRCLWMRLTCVYLSLEAWVIQNVT